MNGFTESDGGTPRAACSNRTCRYQRRGKIAPQARAKPFIASIGNPTPAKPKAGLQKMAIRLRPEPKFWVSRTSSAPSPR